MGPQLPAVVAAQAVEPERARAQERAQEEVAVMVWEEEQHLVVRVCVMQER